MVQSRINVYKSENVSVKRSKYQIAKTVSGVLKKWAAGLSLGELDPSELFLLKQRTLKQLTEEVTGFCYYLETPNNVFVSVGAAGSGPRKLYLTRTLFQVGGKMDKFQQRDIDLGDKVAESVVNGLKKFGVNRLIIRARARFYGGRLKRLKKFVYGLKKRGVVVQRFVRKRIRAHNGCRQSKIRRM